MVRPPPVPLSEAAEQRLQAQFAPEERREARRILEHECGSGLEPFGSDPAAYDRFRFAAMKASAGRIEGLHWAIALAKRDWRDLLVHAGFADDAQAHQRWLVPGSAEEQQALRRWDPKDPLAGSALPQVAGIVIEPLQRHATQLNFSVQGVTGDEFVHALLSALAEGEEVMLPDPHDDCGRYIRAAAAAGAWQTQLICHGRFGDPWHDVDRKRAAAWLLPAADCMARDPRIRGSIKPRS